MPEPRKLLLVYGPESSGSRLVARNLARALGLPGADGYSGAEEIGGEVGGVAWTVKHWSLPYGRRDRFLSALEIVEMWRHRDPAGPSGKALVIVTLRDPGIMLRSKRREHQRGAELAEAEQRRGLALCREALEEARHGHFEACAWSYDAALCLGDWAWGGLFDRAGIDAPAGAPEPTENANLKYLTDAEEA